jgi:hypothetical protein
MLDCGRRHRCPLGEQYDAVHTAAAQPSTEDDPLAKPNYQYQKRQKELEKKKKQEEKRKKKLDNKPDGAPEDGTDAVTPESEAPAT